MRSLIKYLVVFVEQGPMHAWRTMWHCLLCAALLIVEILVLPITTLANAWVFLRRVSRTPCPRCKDYWNKDEGEWRCCCAVRYPADYTGWIDTDYHGYIPPLWSRELYLEMIDDPKYMDALRKEKEENYKKWRTQTWD